MDELREREKARRVANAKTQAERALRDPYSIGGRGSVLENDLARTILALLEAKSA